MKPLGVKNSISKVKNTQVGIKSRLDVGEENVTEFKYIYKQNYKKRSTNEKQNKE